MFAPEDVFDKDSLPKGFYWPSRLVAQSDADEKVEGRSTNAKTTSMERGWKKPGKCTVNGSVSFSVLDKENIQPLGTKHASNSASTSIDGLIREIDENLGTDPELLKPTPSMKAHIDNILSVSDHSDTTCKVMSPSSLQFYLSRFRNGKPTHPTARPDANSKPGNLEDTGGQSIESLYTSGSFNSSSYLERIVSSDDTTEWNLTSELSSDHEVSQSTTEIKGLPDAEPPTLPTHPHSSNPSFLEKITGKSYSELAKIVPPEIINPPDESQDILYQWRLRRHMAEAKNFAPNCDMEQLVKSSCNKKPMSETHAIFSKENVSREIQTDAEKREFSCQANISLDPTPVEEPNTSCPQQKSTGLPLQVYDKKATPEKSHKFTHPLLSQFIQLHQDTCSDVTVSSVSSDDLTSISDLDEEDFDEIEEVAPTDEAMKNEIAPIQGKLGSEISSQAPVAARQSNEPLATVSQNIQPGGNDIEPDQVSLSEDRNNTSELMNKQESAEFGLQDTEELLSYLDNIRENVDDELLDVFIERYKNVLDQMKEIEREISLHANED